MKKKPKALKLQSASNRTPSSKVSTNSTVSHSKWIRINRPFPLPGYIKEAIEILDGAGYVAYVVGGCVRDFLLGKESKDYDIATSAHPDELVRLFPHAITVGKSYGVLKVPIREAPSVFEVATFREDREYQDHRHPSAVVFSGPIEDARRRDFTMNALFYDAKTARILDSCGGIDDLRMGLIRAIGDPSERLSEDALRLIRAVRFAAKLGFKIEDRTAEAIRLKSKFISQVSAERIRDELTLMWTGPNPAFALQLLSQLGILIHILPELEALKGVLQSPVYHPEGDVWQHTVKIMDIMAKQNPVRTSTLAWGVLLHDIEKPLAARRSGGKNFNGHEHDGAHTAFKIAGRLRMSRQEAETISALVAEHLKFKDVFQMRESTLQRFIREPYFKELLALHKADARASDGNLAFHEFASSRYEEFQKKKHEPNVKLISGDDLIQLGLKPSPRFAEILHVIEDLTLEKKIKTKDEALEYVVKHFVD